MGGNLFAVGLLVFFDQFLKVMAKHFGPDGPITIIPKLFYINYVENTGAAFSILEGRRVFLLLFTLAILLALAFLLFTGRVHGDLPVSGICLILAGGFGNYIDRLFRGYVIDYIDFSALWGFPVFNLADICVVIGTAMLLYHILILEGQEKKRKAQ